VKKYDVIGVGNALMDVLVELPDSSLLESFGMKDGDWSVVENDHWEKVFEAVSIHGTKIDSGGSVANTISTVGLLGGSALYHGTVGDDEFGKMYSSGFDELCGGHDIRISKDGSTGKCLCLITPPLAERTLVVHYGVADQPYQMENFLKECSNTKVGHFGGYTVMNKPNQNAVRNAMSEVKRSGGLVSFDLSDKTVIDSTGHIIWELVSGYADIIFLNEDESNAFFSKFDIISVEDVVKKADLQTVVIKKGNKGSEVFHKGEVVSVGVKEVKAVDTTGAGDAYAGGFLYGLTQGFSIEQCCNIAKNISALTVSQIGGVYKTKNNFIF